MKSRLNLPSASLGILGALVLGLAAMASTVRAGTPVVETAPAPPPPNKFLESFVAFSATNYFETSFENFPLSVAVTRYSIYSEFKFRLSPDWMFKIFPYGDISLYSFSSPFPLLQAPVFTRNLRNAYSLNLDMTLAYQFAPGW